MKTTLKFILFIFLLQLVAKADEKAPLNFFIDAIAFKAIDGNNGRIDVFALVPYQTLLFLKTDEKYASKYSLVIELQDKTGKKVADKKIDRVVLADNYFDSQGGNGKFDACQSSFTLPPGAYRISVKLMDEVNNRSDERIRQLTILNYADFQVSLSGVMILSGIEENNGSFRITPHINDNVGNLTEGFFAFFELYNLSNLRNVDFVAEITDGENLIYQSDTLARKINKPKEQYYIKIPYNPKMVGSFNLKISALGPKTEVGDADRTIAAAQRSIKSFATIYGMVRKDIDLAIKQLRYVATSKEISEMQEQKDENGKQAKFDEFWRKLDPTSNTERNEAFDEYYRRINYASKAFKSYTDGWLTDKGMVYVIMGPPNNTDSYNSNVNTVRYERWTYGGNREFIFADNNGFGDYRLVRPTGISEKYTFR